MTECVAIREVVVTNPQGLHARPADLFSRLAKRFQSKIEVLKDGQRADGKSILDMLMLAAEQGVRLTITAQGGDAAEAVDALVQLIEQPPAYDEQEPVNRT
jgi:phosphotransferase system HPr (HPr) family protein